MTSALKHILQASLQFEAADSPALVYEDREYSYRQLIERSMAWSGKWQREELQKGSIIGVAIADPFEFLATLFGAVRLGMGVLPLDPATLQREKGNLSQTFGITYIAVEDSLEKADCKTPTQDYDIEIDYGSPALFLLTSGTTGKPKGIVHSIESILQAARLSNAAYGTTGSDCVFTAAPIYHSAGIMPVMAALDTGAKNLLIKKFLPKTFLGLVTKHGPSLVKAPAFMYQVISRMPVVRNVVVDQGTRWYSGSSRLTRSEKELLQAKYGIWVREMYATSETSLLAVEREGEDLPPQCVGTVLDNVEVKIEEGRILVKTPAISLGYLDTDGEAMKLHRHPTWFFTGDIGSLDQDNRLFIHGRYGNIVNVAGKKVAPEEINAIISAHPRIEESVVIGVDDEVSGGALAAFLVTRGEFPPGEVRKFCKSRLPDYKTPKHIVYCESLPKAKLNKIDIPQLREMFLTKLQENEGVSA